MIDSLYEKKSSIFTHPFEMALQITLQIKNMLFVMINNQRMTSY